MHTSAFAVFLAIVGFAAMGFFILFEIVPSLAKDRQTLRLLQIKDELEALLSDRPDLERRDEARLLNTVITTMICYGEPIGISILLQSKRLVSAQSGRSDSLPTWDGCSPEDKARLTALTHRFVEEVLRSSFLGSRVWLVTAPYWMLRVRPVLRRRAASVARHLARSDRQSASGLEGMYFLDLGGQLIEPKVSESTQAPPHAVATEQDPPEQAEDHEADKVDADRRRDQGRRMLEISVFDAILDAPQLSPSRELVDAA